MNQHLPPKGRPAVFGSFVMSDWNMILCESEIVLKRNCSFGWSQCSIRKIISLFIIKFLTIWLLLKLRQLKVTRFMKIPFDWLRCLALLLLVLWSMRALLDLYARSLTFGECRTYECERSVSSTLDSSSWYHNYPRQLFWTLCTYCGRELSPQFRGR